MLFACPQVHRWIRVLCIGDSPRCHLLSQQLRGPAIQTTAHITSLHPIIYSPVYLNLSYSFHLCEASSSYFQLMIQNPTAVLMNHATKVNLNDFENARKLSIFTLAICASSKIWSVTLRRIASGSARATAS